MSDDTFSRSTITEDTGPTPTRRGLMAGAAAIGTGAALLAAGQRTAKAQSASPDGSGTVPAPAPYAQMLTPDNCVAVLVDYLDGFMPGIRTMSPEAYEASVQGFVRTVKMFDLPTIVLGDEGGFRGEFFDFVTELFPRDQYVYARRTTPSAWPSAEFREWIEAQGRQRILIGGISLDNCTSTTSLDLLANGYIPHVVVDASGTESALVEQAAMMRLSQAGAVMTNWVQAGSELLADWNSPQGPELGALYSEYSRWGALGVPEAEGGSSG